MAQESKLTNCEKSGKFGTKKMIGLAVSFLIATSPVPVMDVLQIYGRLAGPECFVKTVPAAAGASCQLTAERIRETIGDGSETGFEARLAKCMSERGVAYFGRLVMTDVPEGSGEVGTILTAVRFGSLDDARRGSALSRELFHSDLSRWFRPAPPTVIGTALRVLEV